MESIVNIEDASQVFAEQGELEPMEPTDLTAADIEAIFSA